MKEAERETRTRVSHLMPCSKLPAPLPQRCSWAPSDEETAVVLCSVWSHHLRSGLNRSGGVSRGPHCNQFWVSPSQPCDAWAASPQPPLPAARSPQTTCGVGIRFPGVPPAAPTFPQQTAPHHLTSKPVGGEAARGFSITINSVFSTFFHYRPQQREHFNIIYF